MQMPQPDPAILARKAEIVAPAAGGAGRRTR